MPDEEKECRHCGDTAEAHCPGYSALANDLRRLGARETFAKYGIAPSEKNKLIVILDDSHILFNLNPISPIWVVRERKAEDE